MVTAPQLVQPSYNPGDDAGMRLLLPIGRSGWAIVSGYLGLLSLALCFLGPFAIITGVMAIRAIRKDPSLHGMGRAVFGIVGGVLGFVGFVALIVSLSLRG